jgi:hypothetical protein
VFYTINTNKIVTVTAYVFYGKWEGVKWTLLTTKKLTFSI